MAEKGTLIALLLAAKDPEEMLRLLQPEIRRIIAQANPAMLDAFDVAYEDGSADAVDKILHGSANTDELSGAQALGLGDLIAANAVSFLINLAAAITVARCQNMLPRTWAWMAGSPDPNADLVDRLVARSGMTPADQVRIANEIRATPVLMELLNTVKAR